MKLKLLLYFLLFGQSLFCQQNDLRRTYHDKLMYRMGNSFHVGSEKFTFHELETEFNISELGLDAYRQAKKYKTIKTVINMATVFSGLAGIALISNNNRDAAYILIGSQLVLSLAGAYYHWLYNERLDRAIWQRNKDLLFPR